MATQRKRNPNGVGTITKRKDGRFQCAVYVLQPDGTRASSPTARPGAECDAKRRELLDKVDQGVPVPTKSAKLSEWLPYWLDNVIKPRRKLKTFDKYETHVRIYLVPLLGARRLESFGVADVRRFLVRLENEPTAATAREAHRVLRSALSSACREELTGLTSTLTTASSTSATRSSAAVASSTTTIPRAAVAEPYRCPPSASCPSAGTACGSLLPAPRRGRGGRTRTTSSPPVPAARSSRATSIALSPASPSPPASASSDFTTPVTAPPPPSRPPESRPAS